ncbi:MAG TPA: acyl-CoA dehydrogenase family protein [Syntrophorhabdaceae bacterium]|jgi:alkylation response protein AidB-like acyl-CoA dehydrogenase|nr:acyl-CoA/acyl-ACP dehydrogenase [Syntrophorhabdaceae bacterium]HNZ59350.1 acyl-CoA dehydrogenase family protein [Syntrophorhabdaceae bacterium]HOB69664.1 acyl-CoA dehydrogenase family protein [Syntrophorhabdaceae bacterium]HOF58951.1 acyl-CoA dehydrogenase family protein [Syntrophorhabdaceae bacterium]HOG40423.1 acyl-CoA dehydrogenase family protein [Syntrophorhabdaceae bacterium]
MELTTEQKDIAKAAREFAEKEFRDRAKEFDEKEEFDLSIWKRACENGFIGVFLEEGFGGAGLGFLEHCIITEEFWRVDPGCGQALVSCSFGSEMIQAFGSESQKNDILPRIPSGEIIIGTAITEPDAGSDVSLVKTKAEKRGDRYIINGTKMFVTNGCIADYLLVYAVTNPEESNVHKRCSVILVKTDSPGFEALKIHGKLGIRASNTAEVSFSNVEVPVKNLVGQEKRGFYQLMDFFNKTRNHVAAEGVGIAQGALEMAISHVKKRKAFGGYLSRLQGVQFKIAEMATRIEAARCLYWRSAYLLDNGKLDPALVSMAKWYAGEIAVYVVNEALQLHGGYGYIAEYDIQRFYRDAKIVEIYEGSKEVEKTIIANKFLKKVF